MQNSDSHDSSLQAILYIDAPGGRPQRPRQASRIPSAVAVGACAFAALCAVGAITYTVQQQAPFMAASRLPEPVRVTHPAAAQPERIVPQAPAVHLIAAAPKPPIQIPVQHPQVHIQKPLTPAVAVATAKPSSPPVQSTPQARAAATVALATPHPQVAVHHLAPPVHATVYHHHLHRRLAAVGPQDAAAATAAVAAANVNAKPNVADPMIVTLEASPASIPEGSGASICVAARRAAQLSLSGIGEVNPQLLNCRHVSPLVTTTYTAWAVNQIGVTVSQSVTLTVTH